MSEDSASYQVLLQWTGQPCKKQNREAHILSDTFKVKMLVNPKSGIFITYEKSFRDTKIAWLQANINVVQFNQIQQLRTGHPIE